MITQSVSEARRRLGYLIDLARKGEDVVIIKDSKPVASLRPINDSDLELSPSLTAEKARRLERWIAAQPKMTFPSPEAAVAYLKRRHRKKR